jgi:carbon-monoxide dehydrogenase large subunit
LLRCRLDKVRFQGDPVACILAEDRYIAEDAAELITVEYEPLEAVASFETALAQGAARVDDTLDSNLVSHQSFATAGIARAFAQADRIVERRFHQARLTHAPVETRGCIAIWDAGREHLTMHVGTQVPHPYRTQLATRLGLAETQVTIVSPDIGGAFGQKIALYREELACAALARATGRPVRWREDRMENLTAASHAREDVCISRAAIDAEGRILALDIALEEDFGAYCFYPANYLARVVALMTPGPYRICEYAYDVKVALTNKCGNGPMRAPMSMTSWIMEGTLDAIAAELGRDPVDIRRLNMIEPGDLPYLTATDQRLEDITPRETMEGALARFDYSGARARQAIDRKQGVLRGIGLCVVVESTTYGSAFYKSAGIPGSGHEAAFVKVEPSGVVHAGVGLMASGQGYETALVQAVAEGLGVDPAKVRLHMGNTDTAPYGMGSRGARGATAGGGVLFLAGQTLGEKVRAIAARELGLNDSGDLRLVAGGSSAASPDRGRKPGSPSPISPALPTSTRCACRRAWSRGWKCTRPTIRPP